MDRRSRAHDNIRDVALDRMMDNRTAVAVVPMVLVPRCIDYC